MQKEVKHCMHLYVKQIYTIWGVATGIVTLWQPYGRWGSITQKERASDGVPSHPL